MGFQRVIISDSDLDGILSSLLYNKFFEGETYLSNNFGSKKFLIKESKKYNIFNVDEAVTFDLGYDSILRFIGNCQIRIKNLTIFDHHYTKALCRIPEKIDNLNFNISLFEDSTYSIVKKSLFKVDKEIISNFENKYEQLINYMLKVENERFEELNNNDKHLYFKYFDFIKELKKEKNLEYILDQIKDFYNSKIEDEEIKKLEKKELEKIIENAEEIIENREKTKIIIYFDSPEKEKFRYNIPYFYHDRNILVIIPKSKDLYKVIYRVKDLNFWKNFILKNEGGGRILKTKENKAAGVVYLDRKKQEELLYKFELEL